MFCVYVLENPSGRFYVGQTENIVQRLKDHNRTDSFEGHSPVKTALGGSFGGKTTTPGVLL
jgi:predicted GIY-YIG superfamily endonuclease